MFPVGDIVAGICSKYCARVVIKNSVYRACVVFMISQLPQTIFRNVVFRQRQRGIENDEVRDC